MALPTKPRHLLLCGDVFDPAHAAGAGMRDRILGAPETDFVYFSSGPDLARAARGELPLNARPVALRRGLRPGPFAPGPLPEARRWRALLRAWTMAASVPGDWFDEVDASGMEVSNAEQVADLLGLFGTHAVRITCAAPSDARVPEPEPEPKTMLRGDWLRALAECPRPRRRARADASPELTVILPWAGRAVDLVRRLAALRALREGRLRVLVVCRETPQPAHVEAVVAAHAPWADVLFDRKDEAPDGTAREGPADPARRPRTRGLRRALGRVTTPFAMVLRDGETLRDNWPNAALKACIKRELDAVYGGAGPASGVMPPHRLFLDGGVVPPGIVFRVAAAREAGLYGRFGALPDRALIAALVARGRVGHLAARAVEASPRPPARTVAQAYPAIARHYIESLAGQGRRPNLSARRRMLALAHLSAAVEFERCPAASAEVATAVRVALRHHPLAVLFAPAHLQSPLVHLPRWANWIRRFFGRDGARPDPLQS